MKVGIVGAMAEEVAILKNQLENVRELKVANSILYEGKIGNTDIALMQSGIGKVAAAMGTTILVEQCNPDIIINTGSAGGVKPGLKVGDVIISSEVRYHDVDVTAFGYELGQLPNCPEAFKSSEKLINIIEKVLGGQGQTAHQALICTGDSFIHGGPRLEEIKENFKDVAAVEMEAAAIAQVCASYDIPFVVVRAISDAGDAKADMSFEEFLPIAAQKSSQMILEMLKEI